MYRILARPSDFFDECLERLSFRMSGGHECLEFLLDRMIFIANVSNNRCPSFSERRMFRIFGRPDLILSECFECCLEKHRMSRAKCLSIAEFYECFGLLHPNEVGCQILKHSQNSAIDRRFARDICAFLERCSKHWP